MHLSDEALESLVKRQAEVYAVIKFTEDEIDRARALGEIYEPEQGAFDTALRELAQLHHLRGLSRRQAVDKIYTTSLQEIHLTSLEWERFAIQWFTRPKEAVLFIN